MGLRCSLTWAKKARLMAGRLRSSRTSRSTGRMAPFAGWASCWCPRPSGRSASPASPRSLLSLCLAVSPLPLSRCISLSLARSISRSLYVYVSLALSIHISLSLLASDGPPLSRPPALKRGIKSSFSIALICEHKPPDSVGHQYKIEDLNTAIWSWWDSGRTGAHFAQRLY